MKLHPHSASLPIPISIQQGRAALARMYIDLTLAFHANMFPPDLVQKEPECNLILVILAVMLGHAEGHPMTASEIARLVQQPGSTVLKRLNLLIKHGLIQRIKGKYYLEPKRALRVPNLDRFELIMSKAFAVIGPLLSAESAK
jgi:hypothetical protein